MPINSDDKYHVSEAMRQYGGGFVQALGVALSKADSDNAQRIQTAFPELWTKYSAINSNAPAEARALSL